MNSLNNKAKLWEECIQQGTFNYVHKDNASKVQSIFENTIEHFSNRNESIELLNKEFMIKIKEELNKPSSFEDKQKEYDVLLNKQPPTKIDFSDKIDEPIKNIDALLEQTQNNRQELFKIDPVKKQFDNVPYKTDQIKTDQIRNEINWSSVIKTQNEILIKILETQNKILNILQK
jgi:hypothetical protein